MRYTFLLAILSLIACNDTREDHKASSPDKAAHIVQEAIEQHGGKLYDSVRISFTFRNKAYTASRNKGRYIYTREFDDSAGVVYDRLDNDGFIRYLNDKKVALNDTMTGRYAQSVNSVWYFALLPFPLADPAVNLSYQGTSTVENNTYEMVRVSFDQAGGGEDHSDVFLYWFHSDHSSIGYMAYKYETEGGGVRFRKAVNKRERGGITFYDYENYKPAEKDTPLDKLDSLFVNGQLEKVSEITLEDIKVEAGE
ncbi:MAG: DUF6503 family protein [Cyclobacteriaceae bacterium]